MKKYIFEAVIVYETAAIHVSLDARETSAGGVLPHHEGGVVTQFRHFFCIAGNHVFIVGERTGEVLVVEVA